MLGNYSFAFKIILTGIVTRFCHQSKKVKCKDEQNKKASYRTKLQKNLVISCWLQPESCRLAESYSPARIPWFFSGKING
jgi:hypothetical protein